MTILNIYEQQVSAELSTFLADIKPNVERYTEAKASAQKERMLIIGKISDYRTEFPQRSTDHRLLTNAMLSEWSPDVIKKQTAAYRQYKQLKATNVPEYMELAEAANPSQLTVLSRGSDTTLAFDAAKVLKQTGSLPSKGQMEQHLKGQVKNNFEKPYKAPVVQEPAPTPEPPSEEDLECKRLHVTDMDERRHLESLVSNKNLEHIQTLRQAFVWRNLSDEDLMSLVAQKLAINGDYIETKLREVLQRHNTQTVDITASPVETRWDNQVHGGVRWRR